MMSLMRNCLVLLLLLTGVVAQAQLVIKPVQRKGAPPQTTRNLSSARTHSDILSLPFWDDFTTTSGNYPDVNKWRNPYSVWVTDAIAINQPTRNVASFDGLDSAGLAYDINDNFLLQGFTDSLVSKPIDLTSVAVAARNTVFLSFFAQWAGRGEPPDESDYLQLDFRSSNGQWITVRTITPEETPDATLFYEVIVPVADANYFHGEFQFRFRSYGRQSGPYDTWNIDYVYLDEGRSNATLNFPDRAIASDLSPLFGRYYSIPFDHFKEELTIDSPRFAVKNMKSASLTSVLYDVDGTFTSYTGNTTPVTTTRSLLVDRGVRGASGILFPFERYEAKYDLNLPVASDFNLNADSMDVKLDVILNSGDELDPDRTNFLPTDFRENDTLSATYRMRDYYAYDDGEAEYSAELIEAGNQLAYQFQLLVPRDTLLGFDIYLPPFQFRSNQVTDFYIWDDDNGKPGEVLLRIASRTIQKKGINEFQRIIFFPAIVITKPLFYVGWRQPAGTSVAVGLDFNNDSGDRMYVNTNGTWFQNTDVQGSLMIRPVFGSGEVDPTVGVIEEISVDVYPNPSFGEFIIQAPVTNISLQNMTGQRVAIETDSGAERVRVSASAAPGLYLLQFTYEGRKFVRKLVINEVR